MTLTRTGSCVRGCWTSAAWWRAVAGASSGYARACGGAQASGPAAVGKRAGPSSSVENSGNLCSYMTGWILINIKHIAILCKKINMSQVFIYALASRINVKLRKIVIYENVILKNYQFFFSIIIFLHFPYCFSCFLLNNLVQIRLSFTKE